MATSIAPNDADGASARAGVIELVVTRPRHRWPTLGARSRPREVSRQWGKGKAGPGSGARAPASRR